MNKEELIEKYLHNNLDPDALTAFNNLLAADPEFAKEVTFQQNLQQAVIASKDASFKKTLQDFEPKPRQRQKLVRTMLIAASFAILFSLGYGLFFSKPSPSTLFAENFEAYPNVVQPIVRGTTTTDLKTEAFLAYENKDYDNAYIAFNQLFQESGDPYALFYGGLSALANRDTASAKPLLSGYLARGELKFEPDAKWYLALAYLLEDATSSAKELLSTLAASGNDYSKKSQELLEQLK